MSTHSYYIHFETEPTPGNLAEIIDCVDCIQPVFENSAILASALSPSRVRFLLENAYPEKSYFLCKIKTADRHRFTPYLKDETASK